MKRSWALLTRWRGFVPGEGFPPFAGRSAPGAHQSCFSEESGFYRSFKELHDFVICPPVFPFCRRRLLRGFGSKARLRLRARKQVLAGRDGCHHANGVGSVVADASGREPNLERSGQARDRRLERENAQRPIGGGDGFDQASFLGDGVNSASFASTVFGDAFGTGVLAVTYYRTHGATFQEADILFNKAQSFDSYRGNLQFNSKGQCVCDIHVSFSMSWVTSWD